MADKIVVQAMDPNQKNSPLAGPVEEEGTVVMDSASRVCVWNGQEFHDGQVVDCAGAQYECSFGQWVKLN